MIEYKPRGQRNKIIFPNAARTLLAIQHVGLDNLGALLDFGHCLQGLETPADAASAVLRYGPSFAIDVNHNFRGLSITPVPGTSVAIFPPSTFWRRCTGRAQHRPGDRE
jgi:xylose isomerase